MLIYVDDVLHIAEYPTEDMREIGKIYRLKGDVGPPDRYQGGNIERIQSRDGSVAWSLSCHDYLRNVIKEIEKEPTTYHLPLD